MSFQTGWQAMKPRRLPLKCSISPQCNPSVTAITACY